MKKKALGNQRVSIRTDKLKMENMFKPGRQYDDLFMLDKITTTKETI